MMEEVFILFHANQRADADEDWKLVGVYSSMTVAKAARKRIMSLPGFRALPDGFFIDKYDIDKDHWIEGFVGTGVGEGI